jgi:hypothetical protein
MSAGEKEEGGKAKSPGWRRASEVVIVSLVLLVAGLAYEVVELSATISLYDSQISALKSQVANQNAELGNLTSVVSSLYDQLSAVAVSNSSGLEVLATLVVTPFSQGRNMSVTVYGVVYNTLATFNVLTAKSTINPAWGPCQQQVAVIVNVYAGYFSEYNVSYARPLLLYNPTWQYACPAFGTFQYIFLPASDMAAIGEGQATLSYTRAVNESATLSGYWTGSGDTLTFRSFQTGTYTVGVSDVWGSTTVVHFTVP